MTDLLKGKNVVLGVTGSIAAYKIADLASMLVKLHANVDVIMTKNAACFINPITFETLTKNRCLTDTFDRGDVSEVKHIAVAQRADVILIAPASANFIGKAAHGIADDMLSTTILAAGCPVLVSPAMNVNMFNNSAVQENLMILKRRGVTVIPPESGYLACGATGEGKLDRQGEGSSRQKNPCHRRSDARKPRPRPLHHQPLHGKDGLCGGASGYASRS